GHPRFPCVTVHNCHARTRLSWVVAERLRERQVARSVRRPLVKREECEVSLRPVAPTGFPPVTEEVLQAAAERIAESLRPEKILLFGSYAGGTPTPDSDVDLLVIMVTDASRADRYRAVSRLLYPPPS